MEFIDLIDQDEELLRFGWRGGFSDYEYPKVTIIIPTFNQAKLLPLTIDSILEQDYPFLEILVIDAGSKDASESVLRKYRDERIKVVPFAFYHRYEMMNLGVQYAAGEYVNFLFPGDFYTAKETLRYMMTLSLKYEKPDLLFCGTLIRDGKHDPKILYRHLSLKLLKKGQQPTSLQSAWFKVKTINNLGKFSLDLQLRGGYELFVRMALEAKCRTVSTNRVLTDYDLRWVTEESVLIHFKETFLIIYRYFGWKQAITWLFIQKDIHRYIKLVFHRIKKGVTGN